MIEVRHLKKKYGDHLAVDDLSFTVQQGQIYGFLGPNGAGKSTTLNIITGCLAATSGEVLIDGHDIYKDARAAKKLIGYLPEQPPLYPDMTPVEYLNFVAQMKGIGRKERAAALQDVMEKVSILDVRNRLIKNLSKGYKQRVGMAQAILGNPKIIILDEPTVGLDPAQIVEIRHVIKSLAAEHTVIFSSHILSEVSEICSRILIIANGKLVAEDSPEALERRFNAAPILVASVKGDPTFVANAIMSVQGVEDYEISPTPDGSTVNVTVICEPGADVLEAISLSLLKNNCLLLRMEERKSSLEDVFMELVGQDAAVVKPAESAETFEVDAQALSEGTLGSAYDAHELYDSPSAQTETDDEEEPTPEQEEQKGDEPDGGTV